MSTADLHERWNYIISVIERGTAVTEAELTQAYISLDVLASEVKADILRTTQMIQGRGGEVVIPAAIPGLLPPLVPSPRVAQIPQAPALPRYAVPSSVPGVPPARVLGSQTTQVGQPHFDPDPERRVSFTPGVPQRRIITGPYGPGGSQATVTGVYTPPGTLTTTTVDISNHPVIPVAGSPVAPTVVRPQSQVGLATAVPLPQFSPRSVPMPVFPGQGVVNPLVEDPPGDSPVEIIVPQPVAQPVFTQAMPVQQSMVRVMPQSTVSASRAVPVTIMSVPQQVPVAAAPVIQPVPITTVSQPIIQPGYEQYIALPSTSRFTY